MGSSTSTRWDGYRPKPLLEETDYTEAQGVEPGEYRLHDGRTVHVVVVGPFGQQLFVCPCDRRVARLYRRGKVSCRHCLRLAYRSTRRRPPRRADPDVVLGWFREPWTMPDMRPEVFEEVMTDFFARLRGRTRRKKISCQSR